MVDLLTQTGAEGRKMVGTFVALRSITKDFALIPQKNFMRPATSRFLFRPIFIADVFKDYFKFSLHLFLQSDFELD